MKTIQVDVKHKQYDIIMDHGCIKRLKDYFDTTQKILIITDQNIPEKWVQIVYDQCPNSKVFKVHQGEESKSIKTYQACLEACLSFQMSRKDIIIALGGGVIGDLAGFVAATYMRGIAFISIPTTTLSQIDSSIGGKVAINLQEVKNIVGAFHHPDKVIIDFDTLSTLPKRHYLNGLVEAIKAGLIHDEALFNIFEQEDWEDHIEEIIYRSLCMKKYVVEKDEKETGLRKTLNFGHTIGHGIEAYYHLDTYYHGECVAMGMLYFINDPTIKKRLIQVFKRLGIPYEAKIDIEQVYHLTTMDKKAHDSYISVVYVDKIGSSYIKEIKKSDIKTILERGAL